MRVGVLSDTHGFLDESLFHQFADCDEIWHAGDFGTFDVYARLKAFKPIRAVFGNVDGPDLRAELPEDLEWEATGLRAYMTHIGNDRGVKKRLIGRKPDIFLCGHSHILRVARDEALGLTYINPGACGHQGWHTVRTALRLTIESAAIAAVEVIELGPRGLKYSNRL